MDDGLLIAYRAGVLSKAEREDVERLVASSPEARSLLDALARVEGSDDEALARRMAGRKLDSPRVVPPWSRRRPLLGLAVAFGMAAIAGLLVVDRRPEPVYRLEQSGFLTQTRGADSGPTEILDSTSRWTLRFFPDRPTASPPIVGLFERDAQGRLRRLDHARALASTRTEGGALLVELRPAALFSGPRSTVIFVHLAHRADELASVAGHAFSEVRDRGLGWWKQPLTYLGSEDGP